MDLLVLGVHGVLGERLQMFPTTKRTEPADRGVVDGDVAAVALAEHGSFDMGRFELAPPGDGFAVGSVDPLAHVQRSTGALGYPDDGRQIVAPHGVAQQMVFRAVGGDGVLVVLADELHAPGRRTEPDPPGIAANPGFGKGDQIDALGAGFIDQFDGLVDGSLQIEKDRGRLNGRDLECCV